MFRRPQRSLVAISVCIVVLAAVIPGLLRRAADGQRVVLYCAHDSVFADAVIRRFEQQTGIDVEVRYDEEASKSLGLTNLLIAEQHDPRCDVFWNNQTLGTMRLKESGVLAEYRGSGWRRFPPAFRDPDGHWTGFAARLRVWLVNTDRLSADPAAVAAVLDSASLRRVAMARPLFGTTLSHYSVLCDQLGLAGLQSWHQSLHARGMREAQGNAAVKDLVAEGSCDLGCTDTDDAFVAVDAGRPVAMLPVRLLTGQTICLPNSVAIIQGCRHRAAAEKLVDFLLSAETEQQLAASASRQIPLGPVDLNQIPAEVVRLQEWARDGVPLDGAARCHQRVLDWLTQESRGP